MPPRTNVRHPGAHVNSEVQGQSFTDGMTFVNAAKTPVALISQQIPFFQFHDLCAVASEKRG
jgi:hypothetical protein